MKDSPMGTFLANWVMFEELLVSIHASGRIEADDLDLLGSLRYAIDYHYQQWADLLRPYWMQVIIAGRSLRQDPFLSALEKAIKPDEASSYASMEELGAARKTLNLMLSDQAGV
ncbi:MAG: hypothetical protein JW757_06300 [Anaerolineales bacterium]|nr:hypothetical protein [Anaerolineales bacterium]